MSDMSSANNDSEDDDPRVHSSGMSSSGQPRRYELSKSELRKNNKPIMEKKRRARINQCLNELKTLILDALKKDPARHTKLEKADILEMTVRHLQSLHRSGGRPPAPVATSTITTADPSSSLSSSAAALTAVVVQKFQTGYQECAGEVNRFVSRLDGVDDDVKKQLMSHLDTCVAKMRYVAAAASVASPPPPPPLASGYLLHQQHHQQQESRPLDASVPTPNGRPLLQLSHGDPAAASVPSPVGRHRASAFTAVQHGPPTSDADRLPFVYCDEPAVSSTSSWAEDAVAAAAATTASGDAVVKTGPPFDFSSKKSTACGNKRPLGDIPVNVPTAASSHHKTTVAPRDDDAPTPPPIRMPAAADRPCGEPGSDPNMWRPW